MASKQRIPLITILLLFAKCVTRSNRCKDSLMTDDDLGPVYYDDFLLPHKYFRADWNPVLL